MSTPAEPQRTVNVQIDGRWHRFAPGTRIIDACASVGCFIPHYCYHPSLSAPGNCRMCQAEIGRPRRDALGQILRGADGFPEIEWLPRPQITCAQNVSEGMAVRTDSELARDARRSVMEFLLLNHPLDCPICDQAGECRLQEFSVEYGNARSRLLEEKVKKPKHVAIGPRVMLDAERCILCSRCIRFMREIAKDDVLGLVQRGARSAIAVHPDRQLDSDYSLNTVDLCPVGALTSTDFRFRMRVWFLRQTATIDVHCGTGTNIVVHSRQNRIYRITPRQNDAVNGCWMPDSHRLAFHSLHDPARLVHPETRAWKDSRERSVVPWPDAIAAAAGPLRAIGGSHLALLASARMTNEELFLARLLVDTLDISLIDITPRWGEPDGILVDADRNPNTTGARLLGLTGHNPGSRLPTIAEGVLSGRVRGLIALREDPAEIGLRQGALDALDTFLSVQILPDRSSPHASTLLPGAGWAERSGTMCNARGRIQRLNRAIDPPGDARDDLLILRDLLAALGVVDLPGTMAETFERMARSLPALAGITLESIGDLGLPIPQDPPGRETPAAPPAKAQKGPGPA